MRFLVIYGAGGNRGGWLTANPRVGTVGVDGVTVTLSVSPQGLKLPARACDAAPVTSRRPPNVIHRRSPSITPSDTTPDEARVRLRDADYVVFYDKPFLKSTPGGNLSRFGSVPFSLLSAMGWPAHPSSFSNPRRSFLNTSGTGSNEMILPLYPMFLNIPSKLTIIRSHIEDAVDLKRFAKSFFSSVNSIKRSSGFSGAFNPAEINFRPQGFINSGNMFPVSFL